MDMKAHETPIPSADIRRISNRLVESLGGRSYPKSVHSDRLSRLPDEKGPAELATCDHRGVVVDLPDPATGNDARLCLICDAVPRMPRLLDEARKVGVA